MSEITLDRIIAVQAAYIRCIDSNALEDWPDFFADDCLYKVTTAENQRNGFEAGIIYADSKAMLTDRMLALRQANVYEKQSYRHILGLPVIVTNGGGEAECETPFLVVRIMHDGQTRRVRDRRLSRQAARAGQPTQIRVTRRGVRFLAHRHPDGDPAVSHGVHGFRPRQGHQISLRAERDDPRCGAARRLRGSLLLPQGRLRLVQGRRSCPAKSAPLRATH